MELSDLIQVKTLSSLTVFLREFERHLVPFGADIADSVIFLLENSPHDSIPIRRDLLVVTRHIFATEIHVSFHRYVGNRFDFKEPAYPYLYR